MRTTPALLLLFAGPIYAANYATCILDKMPGTANQPTHAAVVNSCTHAHPGRYSDIAQGSGRGLFGYSDGNSCTITRAKDTVFAISSMQIAQACRCLYDAPRQQGELCDGRIRFPDGIFDPLTAQPVR